MRGLGTSAIEASHRCLAAAAVLAAAAPVQHVDGYGMHWAQGSSK